MCGFWSTWSTHIGHLGHTSGAFGALVLGTWCPRDPRRLPQVPQMLQRSASECPKCPSASRVKQSCLGRNPWMSLVRIFSLSLWERVYSECVHILTEFNLSILSLSAPSIEHVLRCYVLFLGICFHFPCMDEVYIVDMRTISFDVPPQEVE